MYEFFCCLPKTSNSTPHCVQLAYCYIPIAFFFHFRFSLFVGELRFVVIFLPHKFSLFRDKLCLPVVRSVLLCCFLFYTFCFFRANTPPGFGLSTNLRIKHIRYFFLRSCCLFIFLIASRCSTNTLLVMLESKPHMGEGGGWGGDAPPLASKNLSPPLEPKIRDLQKISGQKRGKVHFLGKNLSLL